LYLCDHLFSSEARDYDAMDDGDPEVPPQYTFEACRGGMCRALVMGMHDTKNGEEKLLNKGVDASSKGEWRERVWGEAAIAAAFGSRVATVKQIQ